VLRRLKTAREFEHGDRLLQVACQVSVLALEMTENALRDASTYEAMNLGAMRLGACPLSIPHSQLRFLGPPCFRGTATTTKGNGGFGCI